MATQENNIATCPLHNCKPECNLRVMQLPQDAKLAFPDDSVIKYHIPEMFECKCFCPKCNADMAGYEKDASIKRELGIGCNGISTSEDEAKKSAQKKWNDTCADICLKLFTRAVETGS